MNKALIAILVASMTLMGCSDDDDNKEPVNPDPTDPTDPDPTDPTDPVDPEVIIIDEATSINIAETSFDETTGEILLTLNTDDGVAITGLTDFGLRFMAFEEPVEWKHMSDMMGLSSHEALIADCAGDSCDVTITDGEDGTYSLMPKSYGWQGEPVSYKAWLHISTELVAKDPMWIE